MNFVRRSGLQLLIVVLSLFLLCITTEAAESSFSIRNDRVSPLGGMDFPADNGINAYLDRHYWRDYISDYGAIFSAPFHWNKSDWKTAGIFLGITAVLYKYDTSIQDWVQTNRSETSNSISSFARTFGEETAILPIVFLYVYGWRNEDTLVQKTAGLCIESFVISGILVNVCKFVSHRSRPYTGAPSDTWAGTSLESDASKLSFPSGHTASAFSIATIIANEYHNYPLVPVMAYGIATLTGLSRINDNAHWASDVFGGAAIGYFTSKTLLTRHSNSKKKVGNVSGEKWKNH